MTTRTVPPAARRLLAVALIACVGLWTGQARAQDSDEIAQYLTSIHDLAEEAHAASRAAEEAGSVAELKRHVDEVFAAIWGIPSGLAEEGAYGAAAAHGWKTRWQADTSDFELQTPEKFGTAPPEITDPTQLGIQGRGIYLRRQLWTGTEGDSVHVRHVIASLSNVIGWPKMDYDTGARGGMPRIDLTYKWDAPSEFWKSEADTGWIEQVYVQALNILRTSYGSDLATAQQHAAGLTDLIEICLSGRDHDGNGSVEPVMMEGGLDTAVQHAELAGLR